MAVVAGTGMGLPAILLPFLPPLLFHGALLLLAIWGSLILARLRLMHIGENCLKKLFEFDPRKELTGLLLTAFTLLFSVMVNLLYRKLCWLEPGACWGGGRPHWYSVTLVPLAEELYIRFFLLQALAPLLGLRGALIVSSLAFASLHWPIQKAILVLPTGVLLGYAFILSRSILAPIALHALLNSGLPGLLTNLFEQHLHTAFIEATATAAALLIVAATPVILTRRAEAYPLPRVRARAIELLGGGVVSVLPHIGLWGLRIAQLTALLCCAVILTALTGPADPRGFL